MIFNIPTCHLSTHCGWMRFYFNDSAGDTSNRHLAIIVAFAVLPKLKCTWKCCCILRTVAEKAERKQDNWTPIDGGGKKLQDVANLSDEPPPPCQDVLNGARSSVIMPLLQGGRHMIIVSQFWALFNLHFDVKAWATKRKPAADSGLLLFHFWDCFPHIASWLVGPLHLCIHRLSRWLPPRVLPFFFFFLSLLVLAAQLQKKCLQMPFSHPVKQKEQIISA